MGRGGRRTGAGRKPGRASEIKQEAARPLPEAIRLDFDPSLRDSKGHLKQAVIKRLDRVLDVVATDGSRATSTVIEKDIEQTDVEYASFIDRENVKLDETWWSIPAKDRPPLSEFLREKGLIP